MPKTPLLALLLGLMLASCSSTDQDLEVPNPSLLQPAATVVTSSAPVFEDMPSPGTEIRVSGALTADSTADSAAPLVAIYRIDPNASDRNAPAHQLSLNIPTRSENGREVQLSLVLFMPEGGGAGNVVKLSSLEPDLFGVSAFTLALQGEGFTLPVDPEMLAVSGDMRVLQLNERLTAAFDITLTDSQTNQSFRVVGRVNQIWLT